MILDIISFSCPLILCSLGALFSEYTGSLALFLDGLISFSGFLTFFFCVYTKSLILGTILSVFTCTLLTTGFCFIIEKMKANRFIAAIALNLLFSALVSLLSYLFFDTRGVLTNEVFSPSQSSIKIITIIISIILILCSFIFVKYSTLGLYIRITGSDSDVLISKGINPIYMRILAWSIAAFLSSFSGSFLVLKLSSFVPNISSGRGWMALATVFLGKKRISKITLCVIIFCASDYFGVNIQNYFPTIPNSILLSFPYLIVLILSLLPSNSKK